jgi:hypothetical protein
MLLEEGRPLPVPNSESSAPDADLVELVPLSVAAGVPRRFLQSRIQKPQVPAYGACPFATLTNVMS